MLEHFGVRSDGGRRLALNRRQNKAVEKAQEWTSPHWTSGDGPQTGRELVLVELATREVMRARSELAWRSRELDERGGRLDLLAEIEQIDEHAYELARARIALEELEASGASSVERKALETHWNALVDRVAALYCYVDELCVFSKYLERTKTAHAVGAIDEHVDSLMVARVTDEFATGATIGLAASLETPEDDADVRRKLDP